MLLVNVVGYLGAVAQYNKHYSEIFMQIYYCFAIHGSTDLQVKSGGYFLICITLVSV